MQLNDEGLPSRDANLWPGLVVNRRCARLQASSGNLLRLPAPDERCQWMVPETATRETGPAIEEPAPTMGSE
jgi:hypothetical protein